MNNNSDNSSLLNQGKRIAFLATLAAFFMASIKAFVGYFFHSPVLLADAFHSGSDIFINFASGFGLWLASRPKTEKFPYGLYKAETIACLITGICITFAGVEIFREGIHKMNHLSNISKFPIFPIGATILSSLISFMIAHKMKKIGQSIGSYSLIANAKEAYLDVFVSMVVLVGILLGFLKIPYIESIVIILISILIIKLGIENSWLSLLVLLDSNIDPDLQDEINEKISHVFGVKGVGDVKIRQSGPFKLVECVIKIKPTISLYKAHELSKNIETTIYKNFDRIESVFIHVEPVKETMVSAIVPIQTIDGLHSKIHDHFSKAPYFAVLQLQSDKNIHYIKDIYFNEYLKETKQIGVQVVKAVVQYKIDMVFTKSIGEISFALLKDNYVDIYKINNTISLKEIIECYHLGHIERMAEATQTMDHSIIS
ncbi:MAG: cation diffusion facilitator family transporter [Candidatus Magnetomorum sp.]|nr:cation diffusion facilitator family transporter [Candidatus Magnetomorum sp.]